MTTEAQKLPNSWQWVEIKDVADIIVPTRDKPKRFCGDIPWITLPDLDDFFVSSAKNLLTHEDAAEVGNRLMPPNTVLLSCAGSLGKVAVTTREVYANQQFYGLVAKANLIDPIFLAFSLKMLGEDFFFQLAGVSTVGFFSKDKALGIKIVLPPLAEQKRIAAIAQKADRLRRTRRYAVQLGDTYLQSVFLEMFGNPITNPKGWDVVDLDSQIERIDSGWSPVCEESPRTSSKQWAVLRLGAVTWGIYQPNENKLLPPGLEPRPELEVQKGDILITRKNTIELVSACALVHQTPPRLMLPDTIFRFCFKKSCKLKSEYLWGLFKEKSFRKKIQSLATGTAGSMPNISKEKFLGIVLPLPPLPLQEKFAQIVQKFERLRTQQREGDRQADHLFQTLLHRAFRGELTSQDSNDEPASI